MRKLARILPLVLLGACSSFTWQGQGGSLTQREKELGLRDVAALAGEYDTEAYWRNQRRRIDGQVNAFSRDLDSVRSTFARHFLNYSESDPYVNHETDRTYLGEIGRFGVSTVGTIVPVR